MMVQEYGYRANCVEGARNACVVCGASSWSWTDLHGEAYCTRCGTAHGLFGEFEVHIHEKWLPIVKEYFETTGKRCGSGQFLIQWQYATEIEERDAFGKWVREHHPEMFDSVAPGE